MKETIKLKYINKNYKLELSSNKCINEDNIHHFLKIEILNKEEIKVEKASDNLYYVFPKNGFTKNNLYYFKIINKEVTFKCTKKQELLLKIKTSKKLVLDDYWYTYLDKKVEEIKPKIKEGDFTFVTLTDFHVNTNQLKSPLIIKYLMDNLKLDEFIFNGDIITEYDSLIKAYDELVKWKEVTKDLKYLLVYGNHDSNAKDYTDDDKVVSMANFKYLACKGSKVNYVKDTMYGTYDIEDKNVRVITLDTGACKVSQVTNDELIYLQEKLLEKDSKYHILIFAHRIFEGTEIGEKHPNIVLHPSGKAVKTAIDSIFSDLRANLVGIMSGHNHIDYKEVDKYLLMCRTCDAGFRNSLFDANNPYRVKGTYEEQAIDVCILNTRKRKFECIRIGVGDNAMDEEYNY